MTEQEILDSLDPDVREKAVTFQGRCREKGRIIKFTQGRRTLEQQAAVHAKGRSAPGEPCWHGGTKRPVGTCIEHPLGLTVTNAKPGFSWHNFGRAFDIADADASPYDLGAPGLRDDEAIWQEIGAIGKSCGLKWGGDWPEPKRDRPHFEHHGGTTLTALRKAAQAAGQLA